MVAPVRMVCAGVLCAAMSGCQDSVIAPSSRQPPAPVAVPLSGAHTITVTAAAACGGMPAAFRSRTYHGAVRLYDRSGTTVEIPLEGASLQPTQEMIWAQTDSSRMSLFLFLSSREGFTKWLDEVPIVERLQAAAVLFRGTAEIPLPLRGTTVEADFKGDYSYCPAGDTDGIGLFRCSVQAVTCPSDNHHVKLEPR